MMLKLISAFAILIAVGGCGTKPDEVLPDTVTFDEVIGIIYDGVSSRLQNTGSYQRIGGSVAAVFEGSAASGSFRFSYSDFREPTLCAYMQNCSCTGILVGTFVAAAEPVADSTGGTSTEAPYDPTATPTEETSPAPDPTITTSYLALTIDYQGSSLSSTCPPQSNRTVKVQVQNDKTLIYTDLGKDLLFKPRLY